MNIFEFIYVFFYYYKLLTNIFKVKKLNNLVIILNF